ncbi:MAG TPA: DUF3667 domain-containing protein [Sphingomonas sp.]|jgi:hypothetical protein
MTGDMSAAAAGTLCLNCGTRLIGPHCHACGQNGHVHRSLGAIGHELAHGVFHFEGKIWRTLPLLITRPGELTRRYIAGERTRFVSPLALFLFTVFLMFASFSLVKSDLDAIADRPASAAATLRQMDAQIARERAALAQAEAARGNAKPDAQLVARRSQVLSLQNARTAFAVGANEPLEIKQKTGWRKLDAGIAKASDNPQLLLYKLQSSAYKYSWALIPLSTPFVALLFLWRRRFGWYDHAIFVTYSLTFTMLLVITLTLAGLAGLKDEWIILPAVFAPPAHMFAQLRGTYGLRRRSAAWRTVALLIFGGVVLLAFVLVLLLNGLTS